jgi:hypothetical protein
MKKLTLLFLFISPMAKGEDCDRENSATDLQSALSVAPTSPSNQPPGQQLADKLFEVNGLRAIVFDRAKKAFQKAWAKGETRKTVYTIIDYELHSNQRLMWIIDMESGALLYNEYVSHGTNSGVSQVTRMSNIDSSKTSNVGLLKTAETYYGKHGLSLKMDGLEPGFNDNARSRYIVIHGASYATPAFVRAQGRAGRS